MVLKLMKEPREGNVHGFRIGTVDGVQIILHRLHIFVDIPGLGGFRDEAFRLGGGEAEAVEGVQVAAGDAVTVPDFRDGIDVRVDLFQLVKSIFRLLVFVWLDAFVNVIVARRLLLI